MSTEKKVVSYIVNVQNDHGMLDTSGDLGTKFKFAVNEANEIVLLTGEKDTSNKTVVYCLHRYDDGSELPIPNSQLGDAVKALNKIKMIPMGDKVTFVIPRKETKHENAGSRTPTRGTVFDL